MPQAYSKKIIYYVDLVVKPIALSTKRLILRRTNNEDPENLFKNYLSDAISARFLTRKPHTSIDQTKKFLKEWCDLPWENGSKKFAWVIALAGTNEGVGVFLVEEEQDGSVQIHFGIAREHTKKGLVTEAGLTVLHWLIKENNIQKVWALCDLENEGSISVLQRLGFKNQGVLKERLVLPAFSNSARDCFLYEHIHY